METRSRPLLVLLRRHDEKRADEKRADEKRVPLGDAQVEKAIALMRSALERRWTVTTLARAVGLSRAAFARRFVASHGVSPLRYLTRLRMQQAARLLRESDAGLSMIAQQVGYDSEFAFNRAFKRMLRLAPGTFRRQARTSFAPVLRAA